MIRVLVLTYVCGIAVIGDEQSYQAHDYMGETDKKKITKLAEELLKDAKLKLRQTTDIVHEHGTMIAFEVGNVIGQIREKYKRMLETYRDARDRYINRTTLQGPGVRQFKPMHYIISMELIHAKEVEIDKLVGVLESIPKKLLNSSDPFEEMKMKNKTDALRVGDDTAFDNQAEDMHQKEEELKRYYRNQYALKKLGLPANSSL